MTEMEGKGQSCLLTNQVAIITGASSGIGRAIAVAFTRQGATVVCADLVAAPGDSQPTHELIVKEGGKSIFVETDVSDEESMKHLISTTIRAYGRLDTIVNNAGIAPEARDPRPIWESEMQSFDAVHRINVRGVFLGCKYASAQMISQERRSGAVKAGSIINMSSILGVLGKSGTPVYAAAKGAVISLTRAVAMDLASHHIHCYSILPGFTRTPMISAITNDGTIEAGMSARHPLQRLGEADEIADAAVFLASDLSRGMTGLNMSVDGGLHAQLSV